MTLFFVLLLFCTFAQKKTTMNFEEFEIYFWSYIPEHIVSNLDRTTNNRDFCNAVCYDSFRIYEQTDIHQDTICKFAENMLFNVHRFKPILGH